MSIINILKGWVLKEIIEKKILRNVTHIKDNKGRVLISYTIYPFIRQNAYHSNQNESKVIAYYFHEKGYQVDVVHYLNNRSIDYKKYEIIFGFGTPFENSFHLTNKKLFRIFYGTGSHFKFQNSEEIRRVKYFNKRYNSKVTPQRLAPVNWNKSISKSDLLVIIGNKQTSTSYKKYTKAPIFHINSTPIFPKKDIEISLNTNWRRKNFIWFGGRGLIHKGLDLCIEFFVKRPDLNLHIFGIKEKEFFEAMKPLMANSNIKFYGFKDINHIVFKDVIKNSLFSILPTCSEGQSTAILTTMNLGIIPITTIQSGIDIEKFGVEIKKLSFIGVSDAINILESRTNSEILELSQICKTHIREKHSLSYFEETINNLITPYIGTKENR